MSRWDGKIVAAEMLLPALAGTPCRPILYAVEALTADIQCPVSALLHGSEAGLAQISCTLPQLLSACFPDCPLAGNQHFVAPRRVWVLLGHLQHTQHRILLQGSLHNDMRLGQQCIATNVLKLT